MSDPEFNALAEAYESTLMIHAELMLKTMSMEQIKSAMRTKYPHLITHHALADLRECLKKTLAEHNHDTRHNQIRAANDHPVLIEEAPRRSG